MMQDHFSLMKENTVPIGNVRFKCLWSINQNFVDADMSIQKVRHCCEDMIVDSLEVVVLFVRRMTYMLQG